MALAEQLQVEVQAEASLGGSYSFSQHLEQAARTLEPVRLPAAQLYDPVPVTLEPIRTQKQGKFGRLAIAGAFLATTFMGLKELPLTEAAPAVPALAAGQATSDTIDMSAAVHSASIEQFQISDLEAMFAPVPKVSQKLEEHKRAVINLMPEYKAAAKAANINMRWEDLAVIDYRENGNDPTKSAWAGEDLGTENPDDHEIKPVDKVENLISAAKHFKAMAKMVYGIDITADSSLDDLAKGALAYNRGFMYYRQGLGVLYSPYVMNGMNAKYTSMQWPDNPAEPASTRGETSRQIGFLPMFIYLRSTS